MNVNSTLEQLLNLLNEQSRYHRSLLAFLERETSTVRHSDLSGLNEVRDEKEKILSVCKQLEKKRTRLVADLAKSIGVAAGTLNLRKISHLVADPLANRFRQTHTEFLAVLSKLQEANQRNKHLLEHSLDLINGSINLLSKLQTSSTTYYRTGNIQNIKPTGRCVCNSI